MRIDLNKLEDMGYMVELDSDNGYLTIMGTHQPPREMCEFVQTLGKQYELSGSDEDNILTDILRRIKMSAIVKCTT